MSIHDAPDHLWLPRQHQLPLLDRHLRGAVPQDVWSAELGGCNVGTHQFVGLIQVWIMGSASCWVCDVCFYVVDGGCYPRLCSLSLLSGLSVASTKKKRESQYWDCARDIATKAIYLCERRN